jgi:hypothetical protein
MLLLCPVALNYGLTNEVHVLFENRCLYDLLFVSYGLAGMGLSC